MFHIIIPTYNRIKVLNRAINSILKQDFNDYKIYIIDDGSIDDTKGFIENKYSDLNNINYFYKINGGVSSARNFGIEKVIKNSNKGDYILFLDSDDILLDGSLKVINDVILNNLDINYFAFGVINDEGKKTFFNILDNQKLNYIDSLIGKKANGEFFRVLKISIFLDNISFRFPEGLNGGEDILWLKINKKYTLLVSNLIVRKYYLNEIGITRDLLNDNKVNNFLNISELYLKNYGKDLFKYNKKLLGVYYLVYARMLALSKRKRDSFIYAIKGFSFSFDIFRLFLYILSIFPFGIYLNNFLLKIKK